MVKLEDIKFGGRLNWEKAVRRAREGFVLRLVELLRSDSKIPPDVRNFLAGLIAGDVKLRRRKKRTDDIMELHMKYFQEKAVVRRVDDEMRALGRQRDKLLRTKLTRKWSADLGTTSGNVERYKNLSKSRRDPMRPELLANKRTTN